MDQRWAAGGMFQAQQDSLKLGTGARTPPLTHGSSNTDTHGSSSTDLIDAIMRGYTGHRKAPTKCKRCGDDSGVIRREQQTRRADEAITQLYNCRRCGAQWRVG